VSSVELEDSDHSKHEDHNFGRTSDNGKSYHKLCRQLHKIKSTKLAIRASVRFPTAADVTGNVSDSTEDKAFDREGDSVYSFADISSVVEIRTNNTSMASV
jgi:hypothetical protein